MNQNGDKPADSEESGFSFIPILVTVAALVALAVFGYQSHGAPVGSWLHIAYLLSQAVVISVVIWQACDPFADAAQWIGRALHIPGSVRGATLDAVASSMPELFTGIFFVLVAFMASGRITAATNPEKTATAGNVAVAPSISDAQREKASEGFGASIATCAGSAVYNMILIPAFCALFISFFRKSRPTIDVDPEVITRDGLWFLGCSVLLIIFLSLPEMEWWMGVVFLVLYAAYVCQLYLHARSHRRGVKAIHAHIESVGVSSADDSKDVVAALGADGIRVSHVLVDQITARHLGDDDDEDDSAGVFFGLFEIPLNHLTSWLVILISTVIAAAACYWLVEVTYKTAHHLQVDVFFVAVIIAAAASSVPDTFLSVGAAMRGDDSGAVSNAFGSNIFDICVCLAIPLILSSALQNWEPISLTTNGEALAGLVDLRLLLAVLTVVTLLVMWHKRQLTRFKAIFLCLLYGVFIAVAILGSRDISVTEWLLNLVRQGG